VTGPGPAPRWPASNVRAWRVAPPPGGPQALRSLVLDLGVRAEAARAVLSGAGFSWRAGTFYSSQEKGNGAVSGKPGRSGRKSFVATTEQRNNVKILVGLGVPQAMICQLVVNPQTGKPLDEGSRSLGTSSPNGTAARSRSTARSASLLNSQFDCRALTGRQSQRRRHECRHSNRGRRPDAADLFRQWFRRETRNSPHDQLTAYPACPMDPRGPAKVAFGA